MPLYTKIQLSIIALYAVLTGIGLCTSNFILSGIGAVIIIASRFYHLIKVELKE